MTNVKCLSDIAVKVFLFVLMGLKRLCVVTLKQLNRKHSFVAYSCCPKESIHLRFIKAERITNVN